MLLILIICVATLQNTEAGFVQGTGSGPIVNTSVGVIRGLAAEDGDYSMFMGIPYAEVNKSNVFGPAIKYPRFKSIFNAYDDSAICPQREEFNKSLIGSLDCLHLNLYVPNSASAENPLPVLVWIYGGNFTIGFAGRYLYGPKYLVRHDIILVTLNYRVGPYGFLCLSIPEAVGNQGLKDQVLAMRWVKDNIAAFGGDDTKITIGGSSSGAASVDYHLHYSREELFSKAILQSGNVEGERSFCDASDTLALQLADSLNYTTDNVKDAIDYLKTANPLDVVAASDKIRPILKPCVEKHYNNLENYVTDHPINVQPRVKDIEILTGFSDDEIHNIINFIVVAGAQKVRKLTIEKIFNVTGQDFAQINEILERFYYDGKNDTQDQYRQSENMINDFELFHGTIRSVKKYLNGGVKKLFLYLFSYSGGRNYVKNKFNLTDGGARHADELGYLFDISYMRKPLEVQDELMLNRMTELWANFVKYGNPTPKLTKLVPLQSPPLTQDSWQYLELNSKLRVASKPFRRNMAFLDLLFLMNKQYRKYYRKKPERSAGRAMGPDVVTNWTFVFLCFIYYFK